MKKFLIISTAIILFLFAACSGEKSMGPDVQVENNAAASPKNKSIGSITEGSDAIDLALPAIIFGMATGEENLSPGVDLTDFAKRNNFVGARWNTGLSLTVTMTKDRYAKYKADMSFAVEETLEGIPTYPYVERLEKGPDYKTVTVVIDSAIFEEDGIASADDLNSFYHIPMIGSYINVYRMFVGLDNEFSIVVEDSATGVRLGGIDYPLDANTE